LSHENIGTIKNNKINLPFLVKDTRDENLIKINLYDFILHT